MKSDGRPLLKVLKKSRHYSRLITNGFTIVELLVVIVIIGILAAITIVSYIGIQQKATEASLISDLDNASRLLKIDQITKSAYPDTLAAANGGKGIPASSGTTYLYGVDNTANPQTFCIMATKSAQSYNISQDGTSSSGVCPIALHLDAANVSSYSGLGTTWTDISGNNNNGTLMNGVGYSSANGGALSFDGVDDYVDAGNNSSIKNITDKITVSAWAKYNAYGGGGQTYSVITTKGTPWTWLMENPSQKIRFRVTAGGVDNTAQDSTIHDLNRWYYFVGTYDGANIKIFKDGVQVGITAQTGMLGINDATAKIGTFTGATYNFNGFISDVRVYNKALTADEILQNFNVLRNRYNI